MVRLTGPRRDFLDGVVAADHDHASMTGPKVVSGVAQSAFRYLKLLRRCASSSTRKNRISRGLDRDKLDSKRASNRPWPP